jgi:hypothetical protein
MRLDAVDAACMLERGFDDMLQGCLAGTAGTERGMPHSASAQGSTVSCGWSAVWCQQVVFLGRCILMHALMLSTFWFDNLHGVLSFCWRWRCSCSPWHAHLHP